MWTEINPGKTNNKIIVLMCIHYLYKDEWNVLILNVFIITLIFVSIISRIFYISLYYILVTIVFNSLL